MTITGWRAMPDPEVTIEPTDVVVEPGGQARVTASVRNTNEIVEGFRLTVVGGAAVWAEVLGASTRSTTADSDVLHVDLGGQAAATVVFTAPLGTDAPEGAVPFAVLATSVVDATSSAAAEGVLRVGRVDGLSASLIPSTTTHRWSGRHAVTLKNWGNAGTTLALSASEPDEVLAFYVHPPQVELPVGRSATAAVRVRARHPFLRGEPVRRPFTVVADPVVAGGVPGPLPDDTHRPLLEGVLVQKPVLSKGVVALALLAVAALIAGVMIALTYRSSPEVEPVVNTQALPPQGFAASQTGPTSALLSWDPPEREPTGYRVFRVDPASVTQRIPVSQKVDQADGALAQFPVDGLTPATEVCFQISAVQGETQSPRTPAQCVTTPAAAPSGPAPQGGPPPGGSPPGASTTTAAPTTTAAAPPGPAAPAPACRHPRRRRRRLLLRRRLRLRRRRWPRRRRCRRPPRQRPPPRRPRRPRRSRPWFRRPWFLPSCRRSPRHPSPRPSRHHRSQRRTGSWSGRSPATTPMR